MSFATRNIPINITTDRAAGLTERVVQRLLADRPQLDPGLRPARTGTPEARRKIWVLDRSLHCSIIGTCLSFAELRALSGRLGLPDAASERSEHELHGLIVGAAGKADAGARLIHKLLDRKFATAIAQFNRASNADDVRRLWRDARERGEIPGAYWATMTHPATTSEYLRTVFGEVHMLSHLVGAANRADIRRLQMAEQDRLSLQDQVATLQRQHLEKSDAKDALIGQLRARIAQLEAERSAPRSADAAEAADERMVRDLRERLERQATRMAHVEQRAEASERHAAEAKSELEQRTHEMSMLQRENERLGRALASDLVASDDGEPALPEQDLGQRYVLYVGGRGQQVPRFRALVELWNGRFLHHDGGLQDSSDNLSGALGRADAVLFPVDCISHKGYLKLKQLCRRHGTPYLPMRTSSLAAFAAALGQVAAGWRVNAESAEPAVA